MDFKQIKAFMAVVETGSISRAAQKLHVVQPAVSRSIQLLEQSVGVELFARQRHGMTLTSAGCELVEYARRALLELEKGKAAIQGNNQGIAGIVTIGLLPSTVDVIVSDLVDHVSSRYPAIRLRFTAGYTGTLGRWLSAGDIDAALLYGSGLPSDISLTPIVKERLWVVWSPALVLRSAKNQALSLKSIEGQRVILPSPSQGIRPLIDQACTLAGINLNIIAEADSLSVQRRLAITGHGLTILPPSAVADDLRSGQLLGAPLARPEVNRTIGLGVSAARVIARPVQCVVKAMTECLRAAFPKKDWLHCDQKG